MSLDKAIAHGKEHRKPYRGSKAFAAPAEIMAAVRGAKKTASTSSETDIPQKKEKRMKETIENNHVHLCNSCCNFHSECIVDIEILAGFIDDEGNNHVRYCSKYEPVMGHD